MATATVSDLLARVRENSSRKAADNANRYGRLVVRVARGEESNADGITTALAALGRDPAAFAADVAHTVERIELKNVADQFADRAAVRAAAGDKLAAVQREYAAEAEALRARFAELEGAAQYAVDTAAAAEREAADARAELAQTCQDADLLARLDQIAREQSRLRKAADAIREEHAHLERCIEAAAVVRQPKASNNYAVHPANLAEADRDVERARAAVADASERQAAIDAQAAALAAEAAELEARKIEPWPVGVPARG